MRQTDVDGVLDSAWRGTDGTFLCDVKGGDRG
jgi:hypothetical protein